MGLYAGNSNALLLIMVGYLGDNRWWKLVGITNKDYGRTSVKHGNQRLSFFGLTSLQMCKEKVAIGWEH